MGRSLKNSIAWIAMTIVCLSLLPLDAAPYAYADQEHEQEPGNQVTIANSDRCDSCSLLFASLKTLNKGRTEDAGFLFYAAQIRGRVDMKVFDPVGTGGDSPAVALDAIEAMAGQEINPIIMRDRNAFARVTARLGKWSPKFEKNYNPGWEYKTRLGGPKIDAAVIEVKEARIKQMIAFAQLLKDDRYYTAFKTVQDYNLADSDLAQSPLAPMIKPPLAKVSKTQYTAALDRMKAIENARGIHSGLFEDHQHQAKSIPTLYKIVGNKVTYDGGGTVTGADPATFKALPEFGYGKDANHVYVAGYVIPGADPNTFRVLRNPYSRDAIHLFCGNVEMRVQHFENFEVVLAEDGWDTCFDKRGFLSACGPAFEDVRVDRESPAVTGSAWARDGKNWYHGPAIVEGADYDSFKPVGTLFAEDKNQEYEGRRPKKKGSIPQWARNFQNVR